METARWAALKVAHAGFGTPEQVEQMPTDIVLDALEYITFLADYEATAAEINKPSK